MRLDHTKLQRLIKLSFLLLLFQTILLAQHNNYEVVKSSSTLEKVILNFKTTKLFDSTNILFDNGQLVNLVNIFEKMGAVFTKPNKQHSAARRRDKDFYEIPDHVPHALQKRYIAALWAKMGYSMLSLDERCKRQFKVDAFLWIEKQGDMETLAKDIVVRAGKKGIDTNANSF